MLISKINTFNANSLKYQNKKQVSFKSNTPNPKKCFDMTDSEFFYKYGGYKGIVTYNQILALKNTAENSQKNGMIPNLAIAFFADPVADKLVATSQDDLSKGNAKWSEIIDWDSL